MTAEPAAQAKGEAGLALGLRRGLGPQRLSHDLFC